MPSTTCASEIAIPNLTSVHPLVVVSSYLSEQRCPDWLDVVDTGGLDEGVQLVGLCYISISISPF